MTHQYFDRAFVEPVSMRSLPLFEQAGATLVPNIWLLRRRSPGYLCQLAGRVCLGVAGLSTNE